jgi:MOSC domain-containing protein YiiM
MGKPMWQGTVESLHIVSEKSQPMVTVESIRAIPGIGLEGDRYATGKGTYSNRPEDGRQVTLLEQETLEAIRRDLNITLEPHETRRNIITQGVPLNHLVGNRFLVGSVLLEGTRLNVPCQYFEDLLGIKGLFKSLIHRSGLNCRILNEGEIRVGDSVQPAKD